jgi:hypothetical protein
MSQIATAIVEPYNALLYTHTTLEVCIKLVAGFEIFFLL